MIIQFIKFCVVGASGLLVDFGITYLCKEKIKLNKYIANSLGFIAAASSNYLLNRMWTFENTDPNISTQYLLFIIISLIGLGINNGVIYLVLRKRDYNFYIVKVFAIAVVTLWNFFMNFFFTFQ
ncbi:MAG: GtrA family protein [Paludibacteraceae bacterium]|jgi:putative flippase GtrA|nr:GtrA family protein [Paludibacteraceae bacterium]NLK93404.1 GtrA family protein [Bacteroidales bacterium]MBP6436509.1 GtrA family protein [Paludibacteraceae bacterium]MBP7220231.1 GtrA family protein [Paludibacteraceae bacterium]MBP8782431.1 GtrA family protein [Paludibacteraceae bacterium]